jgi:hypothetical protein
MLQDAYKLAYKNMKNKKRRGMDCSGIFKMGLAGCLAINDLNAMF